jgi:hypothetical protein
MPRRISGWPKGLRQLKLSADAEREYQSYLALSNFDTGMAGQLNNYLGGYLFGLARKKRATQSDICRVLVYRPIGLCDSEWIHKQFDHAIG